MLNRQQVLLSPVSIHWYKWPCHACWPMQHTILVCCFPLFLKLFLYNNCRFFVCLSLLLISATSRLLVQSKVYDEVVSAVVDRANRISIGNPLRRGCDAPGPCMGPLVSQSQKERVVGFVEKVSATTPPVKIWCPRLFVEPFINFVYIYYFPNGDFFPAVHV